MKILITILNIIMRVIWLKFISIRSILLVLIIWKGISRTLTNLYDENDPNANLLTNEAEISSDTTSPQRKNKQFSGIYRPPSAELYAGAWLAPKKRLMKDAKHIEGIVNLEGASHHLVLNDVSVMTRDYLDFQILHLSSTTNNFPNIFAVKHQEELLHRMKGTVAALEMRNPAKQQFRYKDRRILDQTVVIIPYSNIPASQHLDSTRSQFAAFTVKMRELYLQATFWSNYRVFPKIIIACGSPGELASVKQLDLPAWKYVDLSAGLTNRHLLPKQSLLYVISKLSGRNVTTLDEDKEWQSIQYVYYSEADEVLTSRYMPYIYALMDRLNGEVAVVPHRMQVCILVSLYWLIDDLTLSVDGCCAASISEYRKRLVWILA
jgi:hypothetical protein